MIQANQRIAVVLIAMCGIWSASAANPAMPLLQLEQTIPLPHVKGGFDLMAADVAGRRLFVAGQDNNTLEVLDLAVGKSAKSVSGLHQPKGIVYLPEMHKVYVSNKDNGVVQVFDSKTFKPMTAIDFKVKANNIRYDPKSKLIYVGSGAGAIGIINTVNDSPLNNSVSAVCGDWGQSWLFEGVLHGRLKPRLSDRLIGFNKTGSNAETAFAC